MLLKKKKTKKVACKAGAGSTAKKNPFKTSKENLKNFQISKYDILYLET